MKNHSRAFGGNRKSPGFRTPSAFRGQVSLRRVKGVPKDFRSK
jgi:hypothetical protein